MEPSAVAGDLNEVSVLVNVAHRLILAIREDVEASASLQGIMDELNSAHDQLDQVLETIGSTIDRADAEANRGRGRETARRRRITVASRSR